MPNETLDEMKALPFTDAEKLRISMTMGCHDCDAIPKVADGVACSFVQALVGERSSERTYLTNADRIPRRIPTVSVDELVERNAIWVEILPIDVQGAELAALKGARALNARGGLRFVFDSTHHHLISSDPLMRQKCGKHGGHIRLRIAREHYPLNLRRYLSSLRMVEGTLSMSGVRTQFRKLAEQAPRHGSGHRVAVAALTAGIVGTYEIMRRLRP